MNIVFEMFYASMACLFFAIVYNTPKKELAFCAVFGGLGYGLYYYLLNNLGYGLISNFLGSILITLMSRKASMYRNIPVMVYVLPSIFPLSPGGNMCKAAYSIVTSDINTAIEQTVISLRVVGVCVIAILIVLSLPKVIFESHRKPQ